MLTAAYVHPTRKIHTEGDKNMIDYTNLYIKNLDKEVTSNELFQKFSAYGKIISARVMKDTATGISKGYGFVSYQRMEEAQDARQKMQGARIRSKSIVITFHEPKKSVLKQQPVHQQQHQQQHHQYHQQQQHYQQQHQFQHQQHQQHQHQYQQQSTPTSRPPIMPVIMDSPPNNLYPVYSSQPTSYSCHGFIPEHLSSKPILPNPWNDSGIWMQKNNNNNSTTPAAAYPPPMHIPTHTNTSSNLVSPTITGGIVSGGGGLRTTVCSDDSSSPNLFQRQKLREAIIASHIDEEQMKDLENLVDLIQSLRKRELSICLFNPTYLRQKVNEAYKALYFDEKPSTTATTPSLVHHHLEQRSSVEHQHENSITSILTSLEGMSMNKKKRVFGDIFFPYVKATGVKRAPKITITLLDTVPLDELAYVMYNKVELTRMAQLAAIEINCAT